MGFSVVDERTYHIRPQGAADVWFHDMTDRARRGSRSTSPRSGRARSVRPLVVARGQAESDGYNALVLAAGLMWRDVALHPRAFALPAADPRALFAGLYVGDAGASMAASRREIVRLFHARFDPRCAQSGRASATRARLAIAAVDRSRPCNRSRASTRTASCAASSMRCRRRCAPISISSIATASSKQLIAVKFASRKLDGLPLPRPLYEIFVYSPRRRSRASALRQGGARRHPLVRPAAGFPHRDPRPGEGAAGQERRDRAGRRQGRLRAEASARPAGPRDAVQAEGTAAYKLFISTLLDITDNIGTDGGRRAARQRGAPRRRRSLSRGRRRQRARRRSPTSPTRSPMSTVSGWATPSPPAAPPATTTREMGITARGAWEVGQAPFPRDGRRHRQDAVHRRSASATCRATCSATACCARSTIKLVAAFDHRDIFIDPDPDPRARLRRAQAAVRAAAVELAGLRQGAHLHGRRRLSALRQGNRAVAGSAGAARLSARAKATPQEVMQRHPQGAGRSSLLRRHRHLCARTPRERRRGRRPRQRRRSASPAPSCACKVIGEGANLGMTQRGRVEAALRGVRLNTDAIDNSAGVNTSDIEVNIKIALSIAGARRPPDAGDAQRAAGRHDRRGRGAGAAQQLSADAGALACRAARPRGSRLPAAPDADAGSSAASSTARSSSCPTTWRSPSAAAAQQPLTRPELVGAARLCQAVALQRPARIERAGRSLSRPRARPLFPKPIAEQFPDALEQHRLRREIIATQLANSMINRGGPSLVVRIADQTGARAAQHRRGLRRGARQLRHDRAQHRDRRARQQGCPARLQLELYAARAGPAARPHGLVPAQRRPVAGPGRQWSSTIATASRAVEAALDDALPAATAARARSRAGRSW